jgi:histidine triad (HIT) family protein
MTETSVDRSGAPTTSDCVFCKIVTGELPSAQVGETEHALAFLDVAPFAPGHTLVVPKRHVADIVTADGALTEIADLVESTARLLDERLSPDGLNVMQASRAAAGQTVFHLHVHVVPRYRNDGGLATVFNPGHEMVSGDVLAQMRAHLLGLDG